MGLITLWPSQNVEKFMDGAILNQEKSEECSIPEIKIYRRLKLRKLALKTQRMYFAAIIAAFISMIRISYLLGG